MPFGIRSEVHSFAGFVLDAYARVLRYHDQLVELDGEALELLIIVVQQRTLTTKQMADHFWSRDEIGTDNRLNVKFQLVYEAFRDQALVPKDFIRRGSGRTRWVWMGPKTVHHDATGVHSRPADTSGVDDPRVSTFAKLFRSLKPRFAEVVVAKRDPFLNYAPSFLQTAYNHERNILQGLPYAPLYEFTTSTGATPDLEVEGEDRYFDLAQGSLSWQQTSQTGYSALFKTGRIKENEDIVRVDWAEVRDGRLRLQVRPTKYHDQARSNLILDFKGDASGHPSLREQLLSERAGLLPELSDQRLANSLGVALLLFYFDSEGQLVPYLVKRTAKLGVFPGGVHVTASGAARWPAASGSLTLSTIASNQMLAEMKEEVGLEPEHLLDFMPVALCREMARGGKPQLFYAGITMLNREELKAKRIAAADTVESMREWSEIERDTWSHSADVVLSAETLDDRISELGLTLEGAAALYFGYRYLLARLPYLVLPV